MNWDEKERLSGGLMNHVWRVRRGAEPRDVIQPLPHSPPIATLPASQIAGHHEVVVGPIAVVEPIDNDLIDDLVAPIAHVGAERDRIVRVVATRDTHRHRSQDQLSLAPVPIGPASADL